MYAAQSVAEKLLEAGRITADQFAAARSESLRDGISVEDVLQNQGVITGNDIAKAKSEIYQVPFVDILTVKISQDALKTLSEDVAHRFTAMPFKTTESAIEVAMKDPLDIQAVNYISKISDSRVIPYYADPAAIERVIEKNYGEKIVGEVTEAVEEAVEVPEEIEEQITDVTKAEEEIKKAPVARIVSMILEFAVKSGASDVHIEPKEDSIRVRFRVNGVLEEKLTVPISVLPAIVSRIKILAKLKIDEKRIPQDGRFMIKVKGKEVDLRVSTLPTVIGEKIVMRLLERGNGIFTLEATGLRGAAYKNYTDALHLTNGIVLITGPTGSGKTRTLASSLSKINDVGINIVTLENPVEVRIDGVNQVQINPDAGLTFASGLRSILRQDPDVIMVGEIRDEETARLAVQASLTGHLVFSTLHTNSAAGALPRLYDMGIEPYLIASTVHLVVAQRLPRKICRNCVESYVASPEVIRDIHKVLDNLSIDIVGHSKRNCLMEKEGKSCIHTEIAKDDVPDKDQLVLFRGRGCDKCDGSGYSGRIGIFEVLKVTEKIGRLIMENKPSGVIENQAKEDGMIAMIQDGYLKALEGITTIEEAVSYTHLTLPTN